MVGGTNGERVKTFENQDLIEIGLPSYAKSFQEKESAKKEAERKENQGVFDAYAAVVELGNSEDGIVFDVDQARKNLVELVEARNAIAQKWDIKGVGMWTNGKRFATHTSGHSHWDLHEVLGAGRAGAESINRRNAELLKNFENISAIFGAYEQLQKIFEDFDKYIDTLCEEYYQELADKATEREKEINERSLANRSAEVGQLLEKLKVETLAAKRSATGSGRSQLTVQEIQELGIRAEKAIPKVKTENKGEYTDAEKESNERVYRSNSEHYSMQELNEVIKELNK